MDIVKSSIINIAKKYGINKAILFGSRARDDANLKSDYDVAFICGNITAEQKNKIIYELNNIDTLFKIDAVFLNNLQGGDMLTQNIIKDGKILMSKFETKFNNFKKALVSLKIAVADYDKTNMLSVRDGTIQRFEYTAELSWKTIREYLIEQGVININTPKSVMKEAFYANIIDDDAGWISILNDRNSTSHIYDENEADEIFNRIKNNHIALFDKLSEKLTV